MIKTILVPLAGVDSDKAALETAGALAHLFDAHIDGLHVRLDAGAIAVTIPDYAMGAAMLTPDLMKALEESAKNSAASARKAFDGFCTKTGILPASGSALPGRVSASYQEVRGEQIREIVFRTIVRDIAVFGRAPQFSNLGPDGIGGVLVRCGRPVLLAAKQAPRTMARNIAIAWKETAEAARALTAAMPLLAKAEKIHILSATEGSRDAASAKASAGHLAEALLWHGLAPEIHCLSPASDLPASITKAAIEFGADLLVMGGYGHSRAREFIFGGFTDHVLHDASLPVLLCH